MKEEVKEGLGSPKEVASSEKKIALVAVFTTLPFTISYLLWSAGAINGVLPSALNSPTLFKDL